MTAPGDVWARVADMLDPPSTNDWYLSNPNDDIKGRARSKQRPPLGDWFVWALLAGRGFGKTRAGVEWLDREVRRLGEPGDQVLVAGRTPADVRDYELHGEGGLLRHHPDINYQPSKRLLVWPNGVEGLIRSGANPEEFRGFSGELVYLGEFAAWDYPEESWNNLIFGVRERNPRICIATTPKPIPILKTILAAETTVVVRGSSDDNRANLSEKWFNAVIEPLRGTRLGRREIDAEMIEDAEGALWQRDWIDDNRIDPDALPQLQRIVVGVDPQGVKAPGRETGIVAAGRTAGDRYVVLFDGSINGTPAEWGQRVCSVVDRVQADRTVGEANFGGDMVENTLRTIRPAIPYKKVNASRGKTRRAEPVASLYQQNRVSHAGRFPQLEDELCNWSHAESWSPNRLDALVWALTELAGEFKRRPRGLTW